MKSMMCYTFLGSKHISKFKISVFAVKPWVFETSYVYFMTLSLHVKYPRHSLFIFPVHTVPSVHQCVFPVTPGISPYKISFLSPIFHLALYVPVILCTHLPFLEPILPGHALTHPCFPLTGFLLKKF